MDIVYYLMMILINSMNFGQLSNNMNKYLWAECPVDIWPEIKTLVAASYNDAVEKLITKYGIELDDDNILNTIENWEQLREYLNGKHDIALSDLEEIDEL